MEILADVFGFLGATCLIVCGLPQLYKTWKYRQRAGISLAMNVIWCVGCLLMLAHVLLLDELSMPLVLNYVFSAVVAGFIALGIMKSKD